jgi:tetratricopeptide (TPR) repeat protein
MNVALILLLGALVSTNPPAAVSNIVAKTTGVVVNIPNPKDPVEIEYQAILAEDDAVQEEADRRIRENNLYKEKGVGVSEQELNARIAERYDKVAKRYEAFLKNNPKHARAMLAYGSFLGDIGEDESACEQWEKARQLDPQNPATWNNLANYYGHRGPSTNAFAYYAKAIELAPNEPVYYHNLGTTVFLFRKDAMEYFHITEQQVFDKALELYAKSLKLDPNDFVLANDIAQTYYGIKPPRNNEALAAWDYALKVAKDDLQREGVYLHMARVKIGMGLMKEARQHIDAVSRKEYDDLKARLLKSLASKEETKKVAP